MPLSAPPPYRRILPRPLLFLVGTLLFLCCWGSPAALAQEAVIRDVVVTNSAANLLLYCSVENGFTREMLEGVNNGIPITFTFYVRLDQRRSLLPDREVVSLSFDHTLTYDNLKEEYQVTLPGAGNQPFVSSSLKDAKRMMSQVNGFRVASLASLKPDVSYSLAIKASLARRTLPLNFQYIVPFWNLWNFETDWYTVQFRY